MEDKLKQILLKSFVDKKIDMNNLILNNELDDEEFLFILINVFENKIDEHTEVNEINYKEIEIKNITKSDMLKEFLNEHKLINEMKDDSNIVYFVKDDVKINVSNILMTESIKYTRFGIEFIDVYHEAFIEYMRLNDSLFKTLKFNRKNILEYILTMFIRRRILLYQKEIIEKTKLARLSHILYSKIKSDYNDLEKYGVSEEYFSMLDKEFKGTEIEINDLEEAINEIEETYSLALRTAKLTYFEELSILEYLNILEKSENNLDKILDGAIFKLSMYEKNDVMDFYLGVDKINESNTVDLFDEFMEEYESLEDEIE